VKFLKEADLSFSINSMDKEEDQIKSSVFRKINPDQLTDMEVAVQLPQLMSYPYESKKGRKDGLTRNYQRLDSISGRLR
jgi:hypothetical protein